MPTLPFGFSQSFGISSFAFAWAIGLPGRQPEQPMDVQEILHEAHRLGARYLQLADNLPVDHLPEPAWQALLQRARQLGIQLELGTRGLHPQRLLRYLGLAVACGSPFLRVVIDEQGFEPGHDQIVETIREVLPAFREAGKVLAIENHDRFQARQLVHIIEATDPQQVGICLDTANSIGADEGIYEVARLLAPYTVNLHVKDYRIRRLDHQMGFTVLGTPAGQGQVPIAWLLDLLAPYGRCRSITLEVWSTPLDTVAATIARERQWVEQSAAFLRHLLEQRQAKQYHSG